jgi:transcriptional regulator with PAS, ATPase and Fis domain
MKTAVHAATASGETHNIFKALMENVNEAVFVIEPGTGRLLEANPQAVIALGYSIAELLALKADQIFSPGMEFLQDITTANHTSAPSGITLVTKHGRGIWPVLTAQAVAYRGQAAVLVIAREAVLTSALAPSSHTSALRPDVEEQTAAPEEAIETTFTFPSIIGQSVHIHNVCRMIGLVAQTNATILIQGESGTGKELVGQAIHFHSLRTSRPLIKVNCAALTETLLESELFGHKKGAFTGAIQDRKGRFKLADGGTIILDEIDGLSLSGQAKLLRVLQEKEFELVGDSTTVRVDVRVVAITNADLVQAVSDGRFREDLYYRLNAFPIRVPPLRERKVDIPLLARHFLTSYTASLRKQIADIDPEAIALLMDYSWPGNVRELENTIEYAVILEKGPVLKASSLPDKLQAKSTKRPSLKERLEIVERQIILEALKTSNGVKTRTADFLGIDRRNLSYFLHKHGIHAPLLLLCWRSLAGT